MAHRKARIVYSDPEDFGQPQRPHRLGEDLSWRRHRRRRRAIAVGRFLALVLVGGFGLWWLLIAIGRAVAEGLAP